MLVLRWRLCVLGLRVAKCSAKVASKISIEVSKSVLEKVSSARLEEGLT